MANITGQTAGTAFNVSATAWDQWDNLKTNYAGVATLAGTPGSAPGNSSRGCGPPDNTSPCSPVYGAFGTWTNGVSSASVTAFKAEAGRQVTATDSGKTGTSNTFAVAPNLANAPPMRFSVQPTLAERLQIINGAVPGVQVTVEDFWGNPRLNDSVIVALNTHPSGGTLSGDTEKSDERFRHRHLRRSEHQQLRPRVHAQSPRQDPRRPRATDSTSRTT